MPKQKRPKASTVLRQAVKDRGEQIYAIASGSGVAYANLMRFISGDRPLSQLESDLLIDYLGLKLVAVKQKAGHEPRSVR
jgi:hypothetical protein